MAKSQQNKQKIKLVKFTAFIFDLYNHKL